MKSIINYSLVLFLLIAVGCTKDIDQFNNNDKSPTTVPANSLFANATVELMDYLASPNVNVNTFRLWSQHWTQSTYTDESNFQLINRNINGEVMERMYARVLRDVKECRGFVTASSVNSVELKNTQLAVLDVLEVCAYSILVDIFNDVPYTEALMGVDNLSPKYDDASTIYSSLATTLDGAITTLSASTDMGDFAGSDLIYSGNTSHWTMLANSLKLRMAMRMADVAGSGSQAMAESAASGVFASNDDHAYILYQSSTPNTNPLWEDLVQSGRTDFLASVTLADIMNATNDPRRSIYFRNLDSTGAITTSGQHGLDGAYADFSQPGNVLEVPTHPGVLLSYAEVCFHLADAANRGWNVGGDAATHYANGVSASMLQWGSDQATADAFLLEADVAWDATMADQRIGTQKWVAMYDQGLEAWCTWKMYDYPVMGIAAQSGTITPMRYNYSVDEYSVNSTNTSAANGGSDLTTDKVFWDVD